MSCGARLAPFDIGELRELTAYDELELDTLGDRKTALFFIMSDTDDTFNFLISMGKPFPQEAELAAKSARLAELNAQLDMGAQRKPASRERGMVKSSRPSVLEGLKRPAPPRTAEKKHQEEVR